MSLKHAILAALSKKPQTGYELSHQIDGFIGYFWTATHQQIYRELALLEKEGWLEFKTVKQNDKPDKKVYDLTKAGLKELKQWIGEEADLPTSKDALLIKLVASQLVNPEIIIGVFQNQYQKRASRLEHYRSLEKAHFKGKKLSSDSELEYLILRRGILADTAWVRWADETLDFLRKRL